jgi:hypothetical protein
MALPFRQRPLARYRARSRRAAARKCCRLCLLDQEEALIPGDAQIENWQFALQQRNTGHCFRA